MKNVFALAFGLILSTSALAIMVPDEPIAPEPVCAESFSNNDQRMVVDCLGRLVRLQLRDGRSVHFVFSDTTMQPFAASVDGVNYFRAPTLPPLVQPKFTYHDDFGGAGGYDGGGAGAPGGSIGGYGGGGYSGGSYGGGGYDPYGSGGYYYDPYREVIEVVESAYRDARATSDYIITWYHSNPQVDPAVCDTMCDLMGQSLGLACIAAGIMNQAVGLTCAGVALGIWGYCEYRCLFP